jgi:hypothetical protein
MAPYIAALVILIVAILFAVYKRVDGFEIGLTPIEKDTPVGKFLASMKRLTDQNKAIKKKLEDAPEFNDTLSEKQLTDLGIPFTKGDDGKITVEKPLSKTLSRALETDITNMQAALAKVEQKLQSGDLKVTQTLEESDTIVGDSPGTPTNYALMNILFNNSIYISNNREAYVNSRVLSTKDIIKAATGSEQALEASMFDADMETALGKAPQTTPGFTKEVEDRIAKSVATQLKDSLLSQRATDPSVQDTSCPYAQYQSNSVSQGQEYTHAKPSPTPDMSEYIRKDSIPCWNCSLP